nr:hypothetical protein [Candidatus Delongbacteria bacterium]
KPVYVLNKIDQKRTSEPTDFDPLIEVSAATGRNLIQLKQRLLDETVPAATSRQADTIYIESRQLSLLQEIRCDLKELRESINLGNFPEIHSFLLRQILNRLDRFTGATPDSEIINQIFERFCIGK